MSVAQTLWLFQFSEEDIKHYEINEFLKKFYIRIQDTLKQNKEFFHSGLFTKDTKLKTSVTCFQSNQVPKSVKDQQDTARENQSPDIKDLKASNQSKQHKPSILDRGDLFKSQIIQEDSQMQSQRSQISDKSPSKIAEASNKSRNDNLQKPAAT